MALNSNIIQVNAISPAELCLSIATKLKERRLELNMTQEGLASRSGVNIETYRKFERKGEISLHNLVKIAFVMDVISDFQSLFSEKKYQQLDDVLNEVKTPRKRANKK